MKLSYREVRLLCLYTLNFKLFTLHENVILREEQSGNLGQFSHGRTVGVRNYRSKFVEGVVQIVHSPAFPGVDVQPHAFPLARGFRFWRAVQPGRTGSIGKIVVG